MTPDDIEPLLPEFYVRMMPRSEVLRGLLASMAALLQPQEYAHDRLVERLDPHTAPKEMLVVLCQWVGMDPSLCFNEPAMRRLILLAPQLNARRGTRETLRILLETCMGQQGFSIEESVDRPHTIVIHAPAVLRNHALRVEAIIRVGKPAHIRHAISWEGQT